MINSIFRVLTICAFLVSLLWQSVCGARIEIPSAVFYYQPAASVFGAEAAWVNPAALARYRVSSFQFMADYFDGNYAKSWGSVVNREGIALGYRKVFNPDGEDAREYVIATAVPIGKKLSFGGSYRYFKEGPDTLRKRHFWNTGLLYHPGGNFSWGAVFSNLNRPDVDGEQTEIEQRYSVSYRLYQDKITLSVDMFVPSGVDFGDAEYTYHADIMATDGLYINGFVTNDKSFQIGLRANLLQYFVGGRYNSDRHGNHLGSTAFFGATSLKQPSIIKPRPRRLGLSVTGRPSENPPSPVIGKKQTSFVYTLLNVYRAADDPSISEMVITLDRLGMGFGQAQELREALKYFRGKNKSITCHISYPNNIAYYVGSACDRILIPPVSQLNLVGLKAELTFYAGTLEKLGIKADLMRIGDYKTGAETYTRTASTEENREQINRLLDDLYDQFVTDIANGRNLQPDSVKNIVDGGPFTSAEAFEYGLVDGLSYKDELRKNHLSSMPEISLKKYLADTLVNDSWEETPVVAIVVADGEVAFDDGRITPFDESSDVTPSKMGRAFKRAGDDKSVRGVVLRIDSPGGLALAGDEIYHAVKRTSEKKPVTVSMTNVAASGGYYIAMPASQIYANPATITGSIGIYGGKVDLSGLYEKIELGKELYTRGKYAGMLASTSPFTEDEREKYYLQLDAMYQHFVSLVADSRNIPADSVDNLGRGRVWTGREAADNGLIDQLGGLKPALDFTASRLGLSDYKVEILPEKRPFIILPGNSFLSTFAGLLGIGGASEKGGKALTSVPEEYIFTRLPFDIEIE